MARRRHRRRRYGDYTIVPALGRLGLKNLNPLGKSVRSTDVIVGAGIGVAASVFVKQLIEKLNEMVGGKIPMLVMTQVGPLSTFLAGFLLYTFQKNKARGAGHFVGASAVAASAVFWGLLKQYGPTKGDGTPLFSDYVRVPAIGLLTADAGRMSGYGLLTRDYGDEYDVFNAA